MNHSQFDRRAFLKVLGLTGVSFVAATALKGASAFAVEACDKVDPKASGAMMVKALKYVPLSKIKGQKCENCIQFKASAESKKLGQCTIIQGCSVASSGWCASWSKKA
jgi:hypothetical protein